MTDNRIFQLRTHEIPKKWLNIQPWLPEPIPPMLNPADGKPVPLEAFTPLFPMGLLEQEVSQEREITIPDEVLKVYSLFRPTPLIRAKFLEEALGTTGARQRKPEYHQRQSARQQQKVGG